MERQAAAQLERAVRRLKPTTGMELIMAQDNISWQRDVDAAIAQAKRDNKPLLLDFTAAPA